MAEILDAAAAKAAQIERGATEWAQEIEQEAKRKSEEMLEDAFNRAWRILDGIDLLESGVGDMIAALRAEMEGFAADLGSRSPAPSEVEGAGQARAGENGTGSTGDSSVVPEVVRGSSSVERLSEHDANHGEVEQMIVEQVAVMFREGRSRADAERLVMRFKQGEDYLHVVDEIYVDAGEGTPAPPESRPQGEGRWGFRMRRG